MKKVKVIVLQAGPAMGYQLVVDKDGNAIDMDADVAETLEKLGRVKLVKDPEKK